MKTAEGQNLSKPNKHRLKQAFEKGKLALYKPQGYCLGVDELVSVHLKPRRPPR